MKVVHYNVEIGVSIFWLFGSPRAVLTAVDHPDLPADASVTTSRVTRVNLLTGEVETKNTRYAPNGTAWSIDYSMYERYLKFNTNAPQIEFIR